MALATFNELRQDLVDSEARRLLSRGKLLERRQKLPHHLLRRHEQVDVIDHPVEVCVGCDIGTLEGVCAQVKQLWNPQPCEGLHPNLNGAWRPLLHEHHLPVIVPERGQIAVVGEVKEFLARAIFLCAGQVGKQVIAVQVHLEGLVTRFVALEEFFLDVRLTCGGQEGR